VSFLPRFYFLMINFAISNSREVLSSIRLFVQSEASFNGSVTSEKFSLGKIIIFTKTGLSPSASFHAQLQLSQSFFYILNGSKKSDFFNKFDFSLFSNFTLPLALQTWRVRQFKIAAYHNDKALNHHLDLKHPISDPMVHESMGFLSRVQIV